VRPSNTRFDDQFTIPTFAEIIALAQRAGVGIYPETKHPTHFVRQTDHNTSAILLDDLQAAGVTSNASLPTFIQSFETSNLKWLRGEMSRRGLDFPLVQLLLPEGAPFDLRSTGRNFTYDQMATPEGLAAVAEYASAIGPEKYHFVLPRDEQDCLRLTGRTRLVEQAHAAGLLVHVYTFRADNQFLPINFRSANPENRSEFGNLPGEIRVFLDTGIDGFFVDHPDLGRAAVGR
jgi:glycerophosphoryl diester phosphodiesterase